MDRWKWHRSALIRPWNTWDRKIDKAWARALQREMSLEWKYAEVDDDSHAVVYVWDQSHSMYGIVVGGYYSMRNLSFNLG